MGGGGTDSVERQISSVFDFLEEPDSGSGCEYWGVNQHHSLTVDDTEEDTGANEEHKDSSDDEVTPTPPLIVL